MADINKKVGSNIRKYRKRKGLTQEGLADKIGTSQSYVAQIEKELLSNVVGEHPFKLCLNAH